MATTGGFQGLKQGTTDFYNLLQQQALEYIQPDFDVWSSQWGKQLLNMLQGNQDKYLDNIYREASLRGMNPEAAMRTTNQQFMGTQGDMMQKLQSYLQQLAGQNVKGGADWFNTIIGRYLQNKQMDQQSDMANKQMMMGMLSKALPMFGNMATGFMGGFGGNTPVMTGTSTGGFAGEGALGNIVPTTNWSDLIKPYMNY